MTNTNQQPFSQVFLDQIRQKLEESKSRIEKELSNFAQKQTADPGEFDASYPEYGDKDDDNAKEVAEYTVNKPLEITLENELRDVNKSLERISKGTYGICKYCAKPIDENRLLARPTSSSCVSCKKTLTQEA